MAPPLPMVPCKARAIGLGGAAVGSPVWGAQTQPPSKNRERGGALALGGRRLMTKHNNQPKVGGSGRGGYWGGRATAVERVGGAFRYRLGAANGMTKK